MSDVIYLHPKDEPFTTQRKDGLGIKYISEEKYKRDLDFHSVAAYDCAIRSTEETEKARHKSDMLALLDEVESSLSEANNTYDFDYCSGRAIDIHIKNRIELIRGRIGKS